MTEPQKETVKHRVTYIANEEETPYVDCEDVGRYMCGDCGQHRLRRPLRRPPA